MEDINNGFKKKIADRKKQADESIEYLVEEILTSDAEKEEYDPGLKDYKNW